MQTVARLFFEAILSNGNRTALEWDHKNWVHNGIYCLLWKKVRLHFIKMSALWCSILRQMLYIGEKASIKSHSYFYISMITVKSQLFFLSESCKQNSALIFKESEKFKSKSWSLEKKCAKGQKISKAIYGILNFSKKRTKITILSIFSLENTQDIDFLSIFWKNWGHHDLPSRLSEL